MNFLGFEIKRTDKSSDVQINKTVELPQSQGDAVIDTLPKSRERLTSVNIDDLIGRFAPYAGNNFYTLYKNISEIQFALNFIVERAKMPQFVVKKYSTDAIVWDSKEFNRLLEKVNENTTFNNYIGNSILMRLLTGNSYCFADTNMTARRYKYTDNFKVLPAHLVKPKLTKGDYFTKKVESYILNVGGRNYTLFPDNILHIKDLIDYEKDDVGVSRLQSLKYPISNLIAVYEARNVIYTKRGALGAIVSDMKDDAGTIALKASEKEDLNKTFNDTYGFEYNKSQYIISDIPVRYIQMGANIRDLEPFKETLIDAIQIASAFQIDGDLIPKERGATFENKKIAELKTLSNFIMPLVTSELSYQSDFMGLLDDGYYFDAIWDNVPILQEEKLNKEKSLKELSDRCLMEFKSGIITLNEWRVMIGKEAIDNKFYDKLITELNETERALWT